MYFFYSQTFFRFKKRPAEFIQLCLFQKRNIINAEVAYKLFVSTIHFRYAVSKNLKQKRVAPISMVKNLAELDSLVEIEHKKFKNPDFKFNFYKSHRPGEGYFTVSCKFNGAELEYRHEVDKENVSLIRDGDSITVRIEKMVVQSILINERHYVNPETSALKGLRESSDLPVYKEADLEKKQAVEFGKRAYSAVLKYFKTRIPNEVNLMDQYFSRSLLTPEAQPMFRTNKEILARFNLHIPD